MSILATILLEYNLNKADTPMFIVQFLKGIKREKSQE